MKKLLPALATVGLMTACYENVPVYFDRPLGEPAEGIDESFQGVYLDLGDITEKWFYDLVEKIESEGDSAIFEEFRKRLEIIEQGRNDDSGSDKDYSAEDGIANTNDRPPGPQRRTSERKMEEDASEKTEDSLEISFNESVSEIISSSLTSYKDNVKYFAYVLGQRELRLFTVDTTGRIDSYPLIELSDTVKLTTYADRYFLNFDTPLGWEIVQIQQLGADIVAFKGIGASVSTDPPPTDLRSLEISVANYYRNLRAIVDDDGQVIGFRARLRPRKLIETFDSKEQAWLRLIKFPYFWDSLP